MTVGRRGRADSEELFGASRERAVMRMFDRAARRYDLLNRLLTFGLDRRWRRRSVRLLDLPPTSLAADLACGTGDFCGELERAGHRAVGLDFSAGMLRCASTSAPLVRADVLRLPLGDGAVDGAVCGFALRNLADLETFFAEVARVVRPGGRIALLEVAEPTHRVLRWGHRLYFGRVVPFIGGLLSDRTAYRYLPDSLRLLPSPAQLADQLETAGFGDVDHRLLSGGIAQALTAIRSA
ncbi:MAG: ubiquinone/menaquinone biosynthesis methyltransferase [bacterium]|nr:ubiquinone/menaquinone biosynthesis methyltransferase [bacterium]